ncbi:conserved hypothetical protein [Gluconacetobacter diazotrophicus PA1 5]|uniref:Uncharacterized protein n=2 Tax=Gluconacetobacter diazotrophicus TaxID=33996 RepID=A0A7W4NLP7_GLUDI|nr:hypothetical protein [Gluconacetobacter diazotrophicus]ACI50605.1 conserved hypothetical protein [Gluconacetobacter diazotrophicus PA1 5]MBB2157558.1 hypothetical protein [Gluconacetobacter diazotrophicus]TWB09437.1 hypothetical protein FBZ86_104100 [Gluconacetobacter diazotrophicus]CAP56524.1 putative exported protein [Gluconacetobacter diazotrophicus PA1 5]
MNTRCGCPGTIPARGRDRMPSAAQWAEWGGRAAVLLAVAWAACMVWNGGAGLHALSQATAAFFAA